MTDSLNNSAQKKSNSQPEFQILQYNNDGSALFEQSRQTPQVYMSPSKVDHLAEKYEIT